MGSNPAQGYNKFSITPEVVQCWVFLYKLSRQSSKNLSLILLIDRILSLTKVGWARFCLWVSTCGCSDRGHYDPCSGRLRRFCMIAAAAEDVSSAIAAIVEIILKPSITCERE